jgi:succinyl-diaminopimelate desuccinylase
LRHNRRVPTTPSASPSPVDSTGADVLDLTLDVVDLTAALVDVPSVSREERRLADLVERALRGLTHLDVTREGNTVVARTSLDRDRRVVLAGHLDTVPPADNQRAVFSDGHDDGRHLAGLGSCDMKGGVAVLLRLAATVPEPDVDITYLFYECEEIEAPANGLYKLAGSQPDLLAGDFAVLAEPTDAVVEGGCQGSLHVEVTVPGVRAHSARSWMGSNAIHEAGVLLSRLAAYSAARPVVDGLEFREGLNAVSITGGIAGNVIPDACTIGINFRYAPNRTPEAAEAHLREVLAPYEVVVSDNVAGASPGLDRPAAADFVRAIGAPVRAKFGWTDVARFAALGIPAVNFGPGDPSLAHSAGEFVPVVQLVQCEESLRRWLNQPSGPSGHTAGSGDGGEGT